jgi:hypothetical protein
MHKLELLGGFLNRFNKSREGQEKRIIDLENQVQFLVSQDKLKNKFKKHKQTIRNYVGVLC